jgi:hypothetical protein
MVQSSSRLEGRNKGKSELLRLHTECVSALERYVAEADKLCQMLGTYNDGATGVTERVALVAQRQLENEAQAEYLRARKRLLRRAHLRSTSRASRYVPSSYGALA